MIVSNLAVTIAQSGRTIAIVDGNLRLPRLHSLFGLRNDVGLSSVLKRETEAKNALQKSSIPGIYVLTSGPIPPHPAELLGSPQMHALVEYLKSEYDMVLIDSPSILSVADATVITLAVDGVIFVVGRALAQRELVKAALEQLHSLKSKIYGVIVNRSEYIGNYQYYQSMQRRRRRQRRIIP
jgi:non-specific protein-tyrosine kinase